jgi:hypothetical protein
MTEPTPTRPVPGPPRRPAAAADEAEAPAADAVDRFAGLEQQPVAEHVAVFEAEHSRLERELGTIDRL